MERWIRSAPVTNGLVLSTIGISILIYCNLFSKKDISWPGAEITNFKHIWKIISSQLYPGNIEIKMLWALYLLRTHLEELERVHYVQSKKFLIRLIIIMACIGFSNHFFLNEKHLFNVFRSAIYYLWSKLTTTEIDFFFLKITSTYVPWILLIINLSINLPIRQTLSGMIIGHLIFYFDFVLPSIIAKKRKFGRKSIS